MSWNVMVGTIRDQILFQGCMVHTNVHRNTSSWYVRNHVLGCGSLEKEITCFSYMITMPLPFNLANRIESLPRISSTSLEIRGNGGDLNMNSWPGNGVVFLSGEFFVVYLYLYMSIIIGSRIKKSPTKLRIISTITCSISFRMI